MINKIKISLNSLQWTLLVNLIKNVTQLCPIEDYQLESCVIADMYKQKLSTFTFFSAGENGKMKLSFSYTQILAIHYFLADNSEHYNTILRSLFEPYINPGNKWLENF